MTGLVIRACIVFVLGLGILACATTAPPISSPTPIAAAKETESQADLEASDQICGVKRPDDRYRGTYYSAADLGEGEHASAVAGWGTAQMLAGLSATETVFFVAYCDMREAGLPQVEAHNLAASVALQNEDWTSGRVAVPEGPEALRLVTPYKPLVAALGPAPIPTPEAQVEIAPTVTRPPFVWAADRTPTPSPTAPISTPTPTPIDYDEDNDGLIEVRTLAQLNAIRWDYNGDGQAASDAAVAYGAAFPEGMDDMGCPADGCSGYELVADLDFDTNSNGYADAGDAYWNDGEGWRPMRSKWVRHHEGLASARDVGLDFVHLGGVGEDVCELSVNCGWGFSAVGFQPRQCNISVGQPQHEVRRFRYVSNFCTKSSWHVRGERPYHRQPVAKASVPGQLRHHQERGAYWGLRGSRLWSLALREPGHSQRYHGQRRGGKRNPRG